MGKLDQILQAAGANIDESMGADRRRPMHGAMPAPKAAGPDRLAGLSRSKDAAEIPVEKIDRDPGQPREEFDEEALGRLAESLKARGQLQPIRVRWDEARGLYVIICGERRWRAAKIAGMKTMSCVIVDRSLSAADLLAIQYVENALREDLRPVEQAKAFRALIDLNGWSGNQLARELSINQATVARTLALLDLPESVRAQVEQGALPPASAYEVSKLDDPALQAEVASRAVSEGLSRSEVIEAVRVAGRSPRAGKSKGRAPRKVTSRTLRTSTGHKVTVEHRRGIDPAGLVEALEAAAVMARAELEGRAGAA